MTCQIKRYKLIRRFMAGKIQSIFQGGPAHVQGNFYRGNDCEGSGIFGFAEPTLRLKW